MSVSVAYYHLPCLCCESLRNEIRASLLLLQLHFIKPTSAKLDTKTGQTAVFTHTGRPPVLSNKHLPSDSCVPGAAGAKMNKDLSPQDLGEPGHKTMAGDG